MHRRQVLAIAAAALLTACAGDTRPAPDYAAIVANPERSDADRQTDVRRSPAELLAFTGVRTGMKVLDMGAGAGYSTELMARAVGPMGTVYAQNSAEDAVRMKERLDGRFNKPTMKHV